MKISPGKKQMDLKLKAIEKTKSDIAKLRDSLRGQIDDLEGILDSCSEAHDLLEDGMQAFSNATTELSKYL